MGLYSRCKCKPALGACRSLQAHWSDQLEDTTPPPQRLPLFSVKCYENCYWLINPSLRKFHICTDRGVVLRTKQTISDRPREEILCNRGSDGDNCSWNSIAVVGLSRVTSLHYGNPYQPMLRRRYHYLAGKELCDTHHPRVPPEP